MLLDLQMRRSTFVKISSTYFLHSREEKKKNLSHFCAFLSTNFFYFCERNKEWKNLSNFSAFPHGKAVAKHFHNSHTLGEKRPHKCALHLLLLVHICMTGEFFQFSFSWESNLAISLMWKIEIFFKKENQFAFSSPTRKMCQQLKKKLYEKSK